MANKQTLVIMVPTYNEVENTPLMLGALDKVAEKLPKYKTEVLVVDDNSPDDTGKAVKKYKSKNIKVTLASAPKQGLGKALVRGYKKALEMRADLVASIDADFLFDPNDIPKLVEALEKGADVAIGSRHSKKGFRVANWPLGRYVTHFIANDIFAGVVAGNTIVKDHNGNFRVIKAKILQKIDWQTIPTKGYGLLNYMIYELEKQGAKFSEVDVKLTWRTLGESKVSFNPKYIKYFIKDTSEYIWTCLRIRGLRIRDYWQKLPLY